MKVHDEDEDWDDIYDERCDVAKELGTEEMAFLMTTANFGPDNQRIHFMVHWEKLVEEIMAPK